MLFIYGTLRAGCRNRHHIGQYIISETPAITLGKLFMRAGYRSPFLNAQGDTRVLGELIELQDEAPTLKNLDVAEGQNYVRTKITVTTKEELSQEAWAYVSRWEDVPRDADIINSGDYVQYLRDGGRSI